MASSRSKGTTYQVFLSFRGPDTRQGFTDVLYHALIDAGIHVFRDNEEIRKGEEIGEEMLRAIEEAVIFVPIFSSGYASSKWCLLELTKMVDLKEESGGKKILPIFYHVGVDDVKLKTDLYSKSLNEHLEKYGAETVKKWEEALRQAGKFKGWELKDKGCDQEEALVEFLDIETSDVRFVGIYGMGGIGKTTLAKVVFNKICDHFDYCSFLADVRESSRRHKGIENLQKQLLGDLGLSLREIKDVEGGIKSIRESLVQKKVLIVLDDVDHQKQIHSLARDPSWFGSRSRIIITTRNQQLLEKEMLRNRTLEVEIMKPEEARRLFCMHAFQEGSPPSGYFSLLDEAVASTGGLPLSLEVIGSHLRDKSYKNWVAIIKRLKKVPHEDVQEKLMISYESLSHGMKQIFLDIACFFIGEEKTYPIYMWQTCDFDPEMGLKELAFMSLVKIVPEKKFISGVKRKTLWMHDQLRDLGREIVYRKSIEDGVKPSRLWLHEEASRMLHGEEGREHTEMLRLGCGGSREQYTFTRKEISTLLKLRYLECFRANFSGEMTDMLPNLRWLSWRRCPPIFMGTGIFMRNLVILDLSYSDIDENWSGWVQIGVGSTLKVLDLSGCETLRKTPDLSAYTSLERLILAHCTSLVEIDPSIGKLKGLKHLDVSKCYRLGGFPQELCSLYNLEVVLLSLDFFGRKRFLMPELIDDLTSLLIFQVCHVESVKLPSSISKLSRLRHLSLASCSGLKLLPDTLCDMKSLVELDLSYTDVAELPDRIGQLVKLEVLSLRSCRNVKKLPVSIGNMRSLVKLDVLKTGTTELPNSIGNLENLKVINMNGTKIKEFPSSFGMLKRLEELDASSTPLEEIPLTFEGLTCLRGLYLSHTSLCLLPPQLPTGLTDVEISSYVILQRLPDFSNLQNLVRLVLQDDLNRVESSEVPAIKLLGVGKLCRLVELKLDLRNITCIPEEFSSLPRLQKLTLGCPNLQYSPPLPSSLSYLALERHEKETELPRLTNLKNLLTLEFQRCSTRDDTVGNLGVGELGSLASLSLSNCEFGNLDGLQLPENLHKLNIESCPSLEALPALSHLKNLKELSIQGAQKLVEIPEVGELESLQELYIAFCHSVERLQNLSKLKNIRSINIRGCRKLKVVDGICELKSLESLRIEDCDCEDVDIMTLPSRTKEESRKRPFEDLY